MASLQRGKVYGMQYRGWENDPYPRLFVVRSDGEDTVGLNLNYLRKFPRVDTPWSPMSRGQQEKLMKVWMHGIHARFFDFISSDVPTKIHPDGIIKVLQVKFPHILKICYRHYKTRLITSAVEIPIIKE